MRIISQAHRTWAELRAILRNDERNAASMTTFCGVGCGLVFVWVKQMSRQGFKGYMHSVELPQRSCCLREYVFSVLDGSFLGGYVLELIADA